MKYAGMPMGMWVLFSGSFQKQLTAVLGYDAATAKAITKKAKPQYRQISLAVNLLFPLLRQNHCMGFVIMDLA